MCLSPLYRCTEIHGELVEKLGIQSINPKFVGSWQNLQVTLVFMPDNPVFAKKRDALLSSVKISVQPKDQGIKPLFGWSFWFMNLQRESHDLTLAAPKHERSSLLQTGDNRKTRTVGLIQNCLVTKEPLHSHLDISPGLTPQRISARCWVDPTRNGHVGASERSCLLIQVQESTFTELFVLLRKRACF